MTTISETKKRGRPQTGATSIHLRLEPDILSGLDAWIENRGDDISRQGALRVIIESTVGAAAMGADDFKRSVLDMALNAKQNLAPGGLETVKTERRSDGSMSVNFSFRRLTDNVSGQVRTIKLD